MDFGMGAVFQYSDLIFQSILITLLLSLLCFVLSGLTGVLGLLGRTSSIKWVRRLVRVYVEVFRGLPLLVLLYIVFYGLPVAGVPIVGFWAALIALSLNSTSYMIEIFRGGYNGISAGQFEAAESLGLTYFAKWRLVLLPQALRTALPAIGNQLVEIFLGSSLATLIGVHELTYTSYFIGSTTFRYFEVLVIAAVIYMVLSYVTHALFMKLSANSVHRRKVA